MIRPTALIAAAALLPTLSAWGQISEPTASPYGPGGSHTTASYPVSPPNAPQFHSSTLQEGVLRGTASVIQAYYNGQISHAQARILLAEARAREIQLRVINTEAAQTRRRLIEAERQQQRQLKMENELLGQQLEAARVPVRYAEYRLSPEQLDRRSGEIYWPSAFDHASFSADTYVLEKLFLELAAAPPADTGYIATRIEEACERLANHLREVRSNLELDAQQYQHYFDCHRFVLGLKYEAKVCGLHGSMYSLASQ
ncbi:hypothetical protein NG895_28850 [Aeoliella sp. ICT_H6.2]|uniref:LPP20 lipoprotein n=1 Tax=Aeoliella straminimaris TaxID=2954799 RepID=A0A9X2FGI2_9BACT|nr:hypothetical protein [Aeoliella straminimaris]MCO6047933.1 hypothetical protein [Aeoliella straminimaris]